MSTPADVLCNGPLLHIAAAHSTAPMSGRTRDRQNQQHNTCEDQCAGLTACATHLKLTVHVGAVISIDAVDSDAISNRTRIAGGQGNEKALSMDRICSRSMPMVRP